tara:strand:+ start:670 stop:1707 length:1038 start_codon:yes stop_codon:yes gene_type:complete
MTNFENRYVAIQRESAYGSASSLGTAKIGEVDDESIVGNLEILDRMDISKYGMTKSQTGKMYSEGDINWVLQADDFSGLMMYAAMGNDTNSVKEHTMIDARNNSLDSYRLIVQRENKKYTYTGMCLTRLSISANLNEYVMCSATFNGKAFDVSNIAAVDTSVAYDGAALDGMFFKNATVKFNNQSTASAFVKSFSMEINLNLDTDNACALGDDTYTRQPPMQRREVTGTIEFNQPMIDGSNPSGQNGEPLLTELLADGGYEDNPDAGAANFAIKAQFTDGTNTTSLILYDVRYEAPTGYNVSGRDTQTMSVNYRAYVDVQGSNPSGKQLEIIHTGVASGTPYSGM